MLNCRSIPCMDIVEVPSAPSQPLFTSSLLVWCDNSTANTDIGLVTEKFLTWVKRGWILTEESDVRCDPKVWSAVPNDVTAVITHALDLSR